MIFYRACSKYIIASILLTLRSLNRSLSTCLNEIPFQNDDETIHYSSFSRYLASTDFFYNVVLPHV